MRVGGKILEFVGKWTQQLHAGRRAAVVDSVAALLQCGSVVSASMGRALALETTDKHGIKRIDRLLGNPKLQRELMSIYRRHAADVVGSARHPVVLVDWSQVGLDKC